jgi:hypothetical protein
MKSLTFILIFALSLGSISFEHMAIAQESQQTATAEVLTNQTVLDMLKSGLAPEIVIAKIKASQTKFDTSLNAIQELKKAGIPDAVVLAMIQASTLVTDNMVTAGTTDAAPVEVKVPDGTEIEIELTNNVSGQDAKIGDIVDFSAVRPVVVSGVTVIEKGASARGRITTAKKSGRWGKAGKLEWTMQDIQTVDGNRVPARFTKRTVGDSSGGTVAVAATATTILLGPVGLLWGLKKGKPAIIAAGNRYTIFVDGDTPVKGIPISSTAAK